MIVGARAGKSWFARNMAGILAARSFADEKHTAAGQKRKYTGEPYIVHPEKVASLIVQLPWHTMEMVQAAYLHDVSEDCGVTSAEINRLFGAVVAHYVMGLTNPAGPEDGNRAERFSINCRHLAVQCAEVQTIKVADIISNIYGIATLDPEFAKLYLAEKAHVLRLLTKADPGLLERANNVLRDEVSELEKVCK
ncbi:HD domain-containing protein [Herbaspirillum huttiense]|uniref:HD domain-containing protein n=1 Tax=Herbaspirillum huttiense subsp. lycopersici TaxID=3074428 RepID=A0ABU2EG42_9BURK|nr:HD domain-containing protein [Herbaspirillum huttiense]MDR9847110.1 HD domain-containing protein [Herbaspirillum huttiense SE1]